MIRRITLIALSCLLLTAGSAFAQDDDNLATMVIEVHVKAKLLAKGGAATLPIRITMDGPTAILVGEVDSKPVQELAEEIALSVDGVEDVDNRLTVAGAKATRDMSADEAADAAGAELEDAKLETEAKLALFKEIGTKARRIEVEASDGVVSLRGTLPDAARKTIALDTVEGMKDVKKVIDLIEVE